MTGRALWRDDGAAASGVRIRWTTTDSWTSTDATGAFRLGEVPEGLRLVETRVLGSNDVFRIVRVECPQGGGPFEAEIVLRADARAP